MRKNTNQSGFSGVESLLVLVIVVAVVFVGWYVWHAKQTSDNSVLASGGSSQTTAGSSKTSGSPGSKDNATLQSDLNGVEGSNSQANQDLSSANTSLSDQSSMTTVPQ